MSMSQTTVTRIEAEMRVLAEERIKSLAGDAPMLTLSQTARVWGKSPSWVTKMKAAGRVHTVDFGLRQRVPRATVIRGLVKGLWKKRPPARNRLI
jgi:hypothetical protein